VTQKATESRNDNSLPTAGRQCFVRSAPDAYRNHSAKNALVMTVKPVRGWSATRTLLLSPGNAETVQVGTWRKHSGSHDKSGPRKLRRLLGGEG